MTVEHEIMIDWNELAADVVELIPHCTCGWVGVEVGGDGEPIRWVDLVARVADHAEQWNMDAAERLRRMLPDGLLAPKG